MLTFGFGPDTDRLSALYRYGVLDGRPEPRFDAVTRDVSTALGGMTVQMVLVDDHRLVVRSAAGAVLDEGAKQGSLSAAAIEQAAPLVLSDALRDPRFAQSPAVIDAPHLRAYAGVALRTADNHCVGVLATADTKARAFKPAHVELLEHAARRLMEALEDRRATRLDGATGAMTDAAFHEQVSLLGDHALRHKRELSLLVIEIDPFKTLLESLKADLGTLVIDRMGGLGRNNVRRLDSFGRLSESMFAMLLPDTGVAGAGSLAARITEQLAEGWSFPARAGAEASPVGVGVATLRPGFDTADAMIARALEACLASRGAEAPVRDVRVA